MTNYGRTNNYLTKSLSKDIKFFDSTNKKVIGKFKALAEGPAFSTLVIGTLRSET